MCRLTPVTLLVAAVALHGQQISFKDPALEKTVRKYLPDRNDSDPLTAARLEPVILVSAESGQTIHDLTGLEACKKLTFLYLPDARITDLSPLAKLTNLESVTIRGGKIHDLTALASLPKLQYLDLGGDDISDVRPLANLKTLTHLDLAGNKISDIGPLSSLPDLQELILAGNQVSDLGPLAGIKSLWLLDVKKNKVADLSPLTNLKDWRYLYLDQNQIKDLAPVVAATTPEPGPAAQIVPFRTLSISGNPLSAEARSKELPELQKFVLNLMAD